jgi:hypothetical protein
MSAATKPPRHLFRIRRPASARLESVDSVTFRKAMHAENAAEFHRQRAVTELERIAADALAKPPHGAKATIFLMRELEGEKPCGCLMCGSTDATYIAAWRPSEAYLRDRFGMPVGHVAAVLYPLCKACGERHSPITAIEDRILAALSEQQLIPARTP